jgi:hypothetical protein
VDWQNYTVDQLNHTVDLRLANESKFFILYRLEFYNRKEVQKKG